MTAKELKKYLRIDILLELEGLEVDKNGMLACPNWKNSGEKCLKIYPELNGIGCIRGSCEGCQSFLVPWIF